MVSNIINHNMLNSFPLNGVIGIIANDPKEIRLALDYKLSCVEIRADLLLKRGLSLNELLKLVYETKKKELSCLFTLRHPEHGGEFHGTEEERIEINLSALQAGADIIDLELGSEALINISKKNVPLLVSYHDFKGMPRFEELEKITFEMEKLSPDAVKIVPTASNLSDPIQMLKWVRNASANIQRIGFTMGEKGAFSRILTTIFGAPITYATFGKSVATGQLSLEDLMYCYRIRELDKGCLIYGIACLLYTSDAADE